MDSMKSYPHDLAQQKSLLKWPSSSPLVGSFFDLFLWGKLQAASLCIITFWVLCCPSWILGKCLGVRAWRVSKNHAIYKEISFQKYHNCASMWEAHQRDCGSVMTYVISHVWQKKSKSSLTCRLRAQTDKLILGHLVQEKVHKHLRILQSCFIKDKHSMF